MDTYDFNSKGAKEFAQKVAPLLDGTFIPTDWHGALIEVQGMRFHITADGEKAKIRLSVPDHLRNILDVRKHPHPEIGVNPNRAMESIAADTRRRLLPSSADWMQAALEVYNAHKDLADEARALFLTCITQASGGRIKDTDRDKLSSYREGRDYVELTSGLNTLIEAKVSISTYYGRRTEEASLRIDSVTPQQARAILEVLFSSES